jgi:hypothetical protein
VAGTWQGKNQGRITMTKKKEKRANEALGKLSFMLKQTADYQKLKREYIELAQDYVELAESITSAAAISTRIISRHKIGKRTIIEQGVVTE